MTKQFMKSMLFVVLVVPVAATAMEQQDKIEMGKQLVEAAHEAFWYHSDWSKVEHFIKLGADLNQEDQEGDTVLMTAVIANQLKLVEMLIDAGADLNKQDRNGGTALAIGAAYNNLPICHLLIDALLAQNKKQKERIYTTLLCIKQIPGFTRNLTRDLFKPIFLPTLTDVRHEINRVNFIEDKQFKNQLLEKYGFQPSTNSEAQ